MPEKPQLLETAPEALCVSDIRYTYGGKSNPTLSGVGFSSASMRSSVSWGKRLKTVRNADKIFVVDHGEIVQQGTYEELVAVDGLYRRFVV